MQATLLFISLLSFAFCATNDEPGHEVETVTCSQLPEVFNSHKVVFFMMYQTKGVTDEKHKQLIRKGTFLREGAEEKENKMKKE